MYDPLNKITDVVSVWVAFWVPTTPLSTWTIGIDPVPEIGPILVVPRPTLLIFIISLSTSIKSVMFKSEIEFNLNMVCPTPIDPPFPESVNVKFDLVIGLWTIPSKDITAFVRPLLISNWWALPSPAFVKVTADPSLLVDIWKVLLSFLATTANTVVGNWSVFPINGLYIIGVDPTPTNDDFGVYTNSSWFLKLWFEILNVPVAKLTIPVFDGSNDCAKIGKPLFLSLKDRLLTLIPSIALYCSYANDCVILPKVKSFGSFGSPSNVNSSNWR